MNQTIRREERRGAAAVEFAMIIPIFLLLTFGTLEVCSAIFLKEKVTIAAHEGARVAIRKMASEQEAITAAREYLESRDIDVAALDVNAIRVSADPARTEKLNPITMIVQVPVAGNGLLPNAFYTWMSEKTVESRVCMYKEFTHPTYEAELAGTP